MDVFIQKMRIKKNRKVLGHRRGMESHCQSYDGRVHQVPL
jgi:hypothetical protein